MKILVLGLGNDLYGDDGVGIEAVKRLRDEWAAESTPRSASHEISFLECSLSGAALLDVVRGHDALVIIDTIVREDPVTGRIHLLDGADIRDVPGPSPHYISVPQTLAMGRQLGLDMPVIVKIIGIEAMNLYRLGEGLSDEMSARMPAILDAAREMLRNLPPLTGTSAVPSETGPFRCRGTLTASPPRELGAEGGVDKYDEF